MPSLGDIKRRIKSVKNTQQITKAMKMVSAAKLRRAQEEIVAARPYAEKMLEMISRLSREMKAEAENKEDAAKDALGDHDEEAWDSWDIATDTSVEGGPGEGEDQAAAGGDEAGGEETELPVATDTSVEDGPVGEDQEAEGEEAEGVAPELVSEVPVEPWPEDEVQEATGSYVSKVLGMLPWRAAKAAEKGPGSYLGKALGMLPWRAAKAASKKQHPLLSGTGGPSRPGGPSRSGGPKKGIVFITSDRGLCGSFNTVLLRTMEDFLSENADSEPVLYLMGNRGIDYFKRRGFKVLSSRPTGTKRPEYSAAAEIARELIDLYLGKEVDEVYIVYSEFISALTQVPRVRKLLPITPEAAKEAAPEALEEEAPPGPEEEAGQPGETGESVEAEVKFLYEPSTEEVLADLLPKHVEVQFFSALLESSASEHGARMTAMDAASRNASDMIAGLTLKYNRLRQAAITKELMEIISGAESLKS